jgi:hypothetical protein
MLDKVPFTSFRVTFLVQGDISLAALSIARRARRISITAYPTRMTAVAT